MKLHLKSGVVDPTFAVQEQQTPSQQFSLNSYYNIRPDIEFDNSLYYMGKIVSLNAAEPIGAYTRFDSRLSWHITPSMELSLIGQNLFNDHHQEYQPSLYSQPEEVGRTIYTKLSVDF